MPLTDKQTRFVEEYLVDLNATQAAIRAGYSEKTASQQGARLLGNAKVQAAVSEAQQKRSERTEIDQDFVLNRWADIASANANDLVSVIVGACRYCHGEGHGYQWRTEAEFNEACEAHWELPDNKREKHITPVIGGGFGYSIRKAPHPECPRCEGLGIQRVFLKDTTQLPPGAAQLYAGAKQTQHGIEILFHDQMKALDQIAKHIGMFKSSVELTGKDGGPIETKEVSARDIIAGKLARIAPPEPEE